MIHFAPCTIAATVSQLVTVVCSNGTVLNTLVTVTRSSTSAVGDCDEAYIQARGLAMAALSDAVAQETATMQKSCPQPN